jgi:hypothetical protein
MKCSRSAVGSSAVSCIGSYSISDGFTHSATAAYGCSAPKRSGVNDFFGSTITPTKIVGFAIIVARKYKQSTESLLGQIFKYSHVVRITELCKKGKYACTF